MRLSSIVQYTSDPAVFKRQDVNIALRIAREYITKHGAQSRWPLFFEVDREQALDPILHVPLAKRTLFTARSPMQIPAIDQFVKPDWRLGPIARTTNRRDNFTVDRLTLEELDYFPSGGDQIFWNGYRYTILNAVPPESAFWQQTGVWTSMICEAVIAPEGDAAPLADLSQPLPSEIHHFGDEPTLR